MPPSVLHRLFTAAALTGAVSLSSVLVGACANRSSGGAHSPERQSDSEYDLSVDMYQKGEYRQALEHVLKSVELNDENAKAAKFAAELYVLFCGKGEDLRDPDCHILEAEKHARNAVKIDPKYNDAKNTLGGVLILEGKYKDAIALYRELVKDPTYETMYLAWGNLGWAEVQDGQVDEGIRSLKNAVTEPRFCVGHYRLGVAYEKKGAFALADAEYSQALENEGCQKLQDGFAGRARVRLALGKSTEARADLEKCREIAAETKTGKACVKQLASLPAPSSKEGGGGSGAVPITTARAGQSSAQ